MKSSLLLFFASSVLALTVPQSTEAHLKCPVKESLFGTTHDICPHIYESGAVRFEDGRFALPSGRNTDIFVGINIQNGSSKLYSAPFNGKSFGQAQSISTMSTGDNIRGWSWNGSTATYIAFSNGRSKLYRAPFDGKSFGQAQSISTMSTGDNIRGWNWYNSSSSYIVAQ